MFFTMRLKCYDQHGRLWVSKTFAPNSRRFFDCLNDAEKILKAKQVFLTDGNTQRVIHFKPQKKVVQSRYRRSSGHFSWTIPINVVDFALNFPAYDNQNN